jgi:hypothetical protein
MDPKDLAARERLAQEEVDRLKRALPQIHVDPLSGERNVTRFGKRKHKLPEDLRTACSRARAVPAPS